MESALAPHLTVVIEKINSVAAQTYALPKGTYNGDGAVPAKYHDRANVIAVIISKTVRLLYKLNVFVVLIHELLAACDKAIGFLALVKALYVAAPTLNPLERILITLLLTGSSMSCSS